MANEYISREAMHKANRCEWDGVCGDYDGHQIFIDNENMIDSIPAADVVKMVRCRDCKHRPVVTDESHPYGFGLACPKEGAYQDVTCPYLCDDGYYNRMPSDDWFCADGERRTDNGN